MCTGFVNTNYKIWYSSAILGKTIPDLAIATEENQMFSLKQVTLVKFPYFSKLSILSLVYWFHPVTLSPTITYCLVLLPSQFNIMALYHVLNSIYWKDDLSIQQLLYSSRKQNKHKNPYLKKKIKWKSYGWSVYLVLFSTRMLLRAAYELKCLKRGKREKKLEEVSPAGPGWQGQGERPIFQVWYKMISDQMRDQRM